MAKISPTPNILYRLVVLGGLGTATALVVSDDAWEAFDDATGGTVERDRIRRLLGATVGLHVFEALVAWRRARRAGLDHPGRWARATFVWGVPVLVRLRRAARAT